MTKLSISALLVPTDTSDAESAWTCREFRLLPTRSAGTAFIDVDVDGEDVIELTLEDGSTVLATEDDLPSYGFRTSRSGNAIEVTSSFSPPDATTRDGAGRWMLRSLRLWRNPVGAGVHALAGTLQDRKLSGGGEPGWYRFGKEAQPIGARLQTLPETSDLSLLLLHGTISSTAGSFGGLLGSASWPELRRIYGDRVFGLEHRTLTDSPLDNALEAIETLPQNLTVDLITHSRGGLVAELLVRACDPDGSRFDAQTIARHADQWHSAGRADFAAKLTRLQRLADAKRLSIRRLVRVAAPMRGTTLLSGRLDRWASNTLNLAGLAASPWLPSAPEVSRLLREFLLAVTRQRADASVLPGLEAMRPESPWMALLNPPPVVSVRPTTFVVAGDYRGSGIGGWIADRFSDSYYGGGNDWVVNTRSMTGGAVRSGGLRQVLFRDADTRHTTYFDREVVRRRIVDALERGVEASQYELVGRDSSAIARGGHKPQPKPGAPIALLLPGITGSHLQVRHDRIWLQFHELALGALRHLQIGAKDITSDGWIDSAYEAFARFLTATHEVRPFAYDWRLSIDATGAAFAKALEKALVDASARDRPVHIFAHSMGGLVARAALSRNGLWDRLQARSGSRLVMLGTPNLGSHSIPWLLMGQEKTVQMLARVDLRHGRRELVDFFRRYPGVLELMPHGTWGDRNYFDVDIWQQLAKPLSDGDGDWPTPDKATLGTSQDVLDGLRKEPLAGRPVAYVAGFNPKEGTIETFEPNATTGRYEPISIKQGDGRVLWKSGIPAGVPTYFVDAVHGDLADHRPAFKAYLELATLGRTSLLPSVPPIPLDGRDFVVNRSASALGVGTEAEPYQLYPTEQELAAAALGGRSESADVGHRDEITRACIRVTHGSFVAAQGAMLIGRYENDAVLRGTMRLLDNMVGGVLDAALKLDRLPNSPDQAFISSEHPDASLSAIVVGLGRLGDLTPGVLRRTLKNGLLQYALQHARSSGNVASPSVRICTLLIGSGSFGLSIHSATQSLLQAADETQRALSSLRKQGASVPLLECIQIFENDEIRAEEIAAAILHTRTWSPELTFDFDGQIHRGEHGMRTYLGRVEAQSSGQRALIRAPHGIERGMEFTVLTQSARSDFLREPPQGRFVQRMISLALGSTDDHPGLSRALFELLTPNDFKSLIGNVESLVIGVDEAAATVPWELMRDPNDAQEPLATRVKLVRQLVRSPQRSAPRSPVRRALVIGDTNTRNAYARLPGAEAEMQSVADMLRDSAYDVVATPRVEALSLLNEMLLGDFGIMHIAAHGDWTEVESAGDSTGQPPSKYSGIVLSDGLVLTALQIAKLPSVPEVLFLNCCHLGDTSIDSTRREGPWPELAASLAVAFIDRGAKVVIAAGWAVDDQAAHSFAKTFYASLLAGNTLGSAALAARKATFREHPQSNTWGAYQVYGDDHYVLEGSGTEKQSATRPPINTRLAALDAIAQEVSWSRHRKTHEGDRAESGGMSGLSDLLDRLSPTLREDAEVRAALGRALQATGDREAAIQHLEAALSMDPAKVSLEDLEQLANLQVRHAERIAQKLVEEVGPTPLSASEDDYIHFAERFQEANRLWETGAERIRKLIELSPNRERLSLLGSAYKRKALMDVRNAKVQSGSAADSRARASAINEALDAAIENYTAATKMDVLPSGELHHYPSNNLAQLLWLKAVASLLPPTATRSRTKTTAKARHDHLEKVRISSQAAQRHAERMIAQGGDFWDLHAKVHAALNEALATELEGTATGIGSPSEVAARLRASIEAARDDLQRRFGRDYKQDSFAEQLNFLHTMLVWYADLAGATENGKALRRLAAAMALLSGQSRSDGTSEAVGPGPGVATGDESSARVRRPSVSPRAAKAVSRPARKASANRKQEEVPSAGASKSKGPKGRPASKRPKKRGR